MRLPPRPATPPCSTALLNVEATLLTEVSTLFEVSPYALRNADVVSAYPVCSRTATEISSASSSAFRVLSESATALSRATPSARASSAVTRRPSYDSNEGRRVTADDARALGVALERAVADSERTRKAEELALEISVAVREQNGYADYHVGVPESIWGY